MKGTFEKNKIDKSPPIYSSPPLDNQSTLMQILAELNTDLVATTELNKSCQVQEFQVGDPLLCFQGSDEETGVDDSSISRDCYFIDQGRVRLLVFDAERQREICGMVLEKGDSFGL
ncbi:MAG: hypothetical protein ACRC8Y_00750, partial [Chroococcales cyanobacterium]